MTHGTDRDTPTDDAAERPVDDAPAAPAAPADGTAPTDGTARIDRPAPGPEGTTTTPDDVTTGTGEADVVDVAEEPGAAGATGEDVDVDVDRRPVDTGAADTTPADTTPADTTPADTTPADTKYAGTTTPDAAADGTPATDRPAAASAARAVRPLAPPQAEPLAAWPSWEDVAVTAPATVPPAGGPLDADEVRRTVEVPTDDAATGADGDGPDRSGATEQGGTQEPHRDEDASTATDPGDDEPGTERDPRPDGTADARPRPVLDLGGFSALAFTALNAASVGVPAHALAQSRAGAAPADESGPTGGPGGDGPAAGDATPGDGTPAPGTSSGDAERTTAAGTDAAPTPDAAATTDAGVATDAAATGAAGPGGAERDATPGGPPSDDEPAASTDGPTGPRSDDEPQRPVDGDHADDDHPDDDHPDDDRTDDDRTDDAIDAAAATAGAAGTGAAGASAAGTSAAGTGSAGTDAAGTRAADADSTAVLPRSDDGRPTDRPEADAQTTALITAAPGAAPVAPSPSWPRTAAGGDGAGGGEGAGGDGDGPEASGDGRSPSPLDGFDAEDGRRRWPRTLAVVGGAVILLGGLYVGSSYALADRVPRGTTVAGVEIGSMSSDEAEQALTDGLAERTTAPVPVVAQEVQSEIDPAAAGLRLDVDATVARLTGVDLTEPVRLWRHLVGVGEQPPVTQVDDTAMDAALTQLSGSLTLAPVDGTVVFADGAAHATEAVDGWELDDAGAAAVLEDAWLTGTRPLELPTEVLTPAVTQEETQRALREIAQPLTAAPVTVQVGDRQATLDVPTLTAGAALVPVDGTLQLQLDGPALGEAVLAQLPDLLTTAADARFEFQDGAPVIVPGTPGTTLDPAALATSVAQAATAGTDRVAPVELVQSDPAQTTAALEALGVKEIVGQFSTPLTNEPRRTSNIAQGLKNITGTLVRPGETFSLTEALGPVDAAHGFVQAGAIVSGEHTDAWGGGLSQVSTTTFNAAYLAGFEDVEHTPHSEWFSRYPEGQEATIFTGTIDMKWKNNTPYGALVQGYVADGRAHVRIWSTKHFTVETSTSGRSGVVAPTTVYSQSPTCSPQSAGNPGFTVTNTRRVYLGEELVDTQSRTWRYKPQNKVVCGLPPTATPEP